MVAPAHLERRILGQLLARFGELLFAGENQTRHHQRLRPRAALDEPAVDEHLIEAAFSTPLETSASSGH